MPSQHQTLAAGILMGLHMSEIHATTKLLNAQHLTHLQLTGNLVWRLERAGFTSLSILLQIPALAAGCWWPRMFLRLGNTSVTLLLTPGPVVHTALVALCTA